MNKITRDSILCATLVALLTGAPLLGLPFAFLGLLRPLPLFILGLKYGSLAAFFAGTVTAMLVSLTFPHPNALVTFFTITTPVFMSLHMTLKALLIKKHAPKEINAEPVGIVLLFLAFIGFMSFLAVMGGMFNFDIAQYKATIQSLLSETFKLINLHFEGDMKAVFENAAYIMIPCVAVSLWFCMLLGNYALAWRIAPRFNIVVPKLNFHDTRLPFISVLLIGIGFALTYGTDTMRLFGFVLISSLIIPFICQGLAVVHARLAEKSYKRGFLTVFYLITLTLGWTLPFLFFIGLADPAFAFRKKPTH